MKNEDFAYVLFLSLCIQMCQLISQRNQCTWRRMEHGEHFLCSLSSSLRAALPLGHSLLTPQLLLRSIQHQSSPLVPVLLLESIQWASSCLYMEFGWICDYFFIESKSNVIKNVVQPRAAMGWWPVVSVVYIWSTKK